VATPRRLREVFVQDPIYFVTAATFNRRSLLDRSEVHRVFIQFAHLGSERGAWIGRYVLMPDHFHLFVRFTGNSMPLSIWQKSLKNAISKTLRSASFASPHWEKGFFDHVIRSEESYDQKWEYVRRNPVRASLVDEPDAYPYAGEIFQLDQRL